MPVARPSPTRRSPLAKGSSVPACPTRRSPSTVRIRATTSCEVQPSGLSSRWRESAIHRLVERFESLVVDGAEISLHARSGRLLVSPAAEACRHRVHVHRSIGAETEPDLAGNNLLPENADERADER